MVRRVLKNFRLDGRLCDLVAEDGVILSVGKTELPGEDCEGYDLFPGLFDTHTHGAAGVDTMEIMNGGLDRLSLFQLEHGTTSFLPTTMTMDIPTIRRVLESETEHLPGAKVPGFHMEGPYVAEKYKGAQNGAFLRNPDLEEFLSLPKVLKITMAPELPGALDFIRACPALVSIGHTAADYDETVAAIENGAGCLTHTFNAMSPLHHRNPGPIGAAVEKGIYAEVICDGLHVSKAAFLTLYRAVGPDRLILVSDSLRATGLGDGVFDFGGQPIIVKDGVARIEAGNLAGSTSTLLDCVRKAVEFGVSKKDAVKMATQTPAASLGLKKGKIQAGYDAEFILLDRDMNLVRSIIL